MQRKQDGEIKKHSNENDVIQVLVVLGGCLVSYAEANFNVKQIENIPRHHAGDSSANRRILAKTSEEETRTKGFNPSLTHVTISQDAL